MTLQVTLTRSAISDVSVESAALKRIVWFAILQIATLVSTFVVYVLYLRGILTTFLVFSPGTTPSPATVSSLFQGFVTYMTYMTPIIVVSLALGLMAIYLLLGAFRRFSKLDSSSFSTPATLMLFPLVGGLIIAAGVALSLLWAVSLLLQIALPQIAQTLSATPSLGAISLGLGFSMALVIAGLVILTIGVIGGEILGLWRVGTRYDLTVIKLGAVLEIFPFLNCAGAVLLLLGGLDARKKVGNQFRS